MRFLSVNKNIVYQTLPYNKLKDRSLHYIDYARSNGKTGIGVCSDQNLNNFIY